MSDTEIIELYLERNENAVNETAKQYGSYCRTIAMNVLQNPEDADECVNDAYLCLWNAIPPEHPKAFSTYIGRITRNLSIKKYKKRNAQKRGGNETALLLSELENCVPSAHSVAKEVEASELAEMIDEFLQSVKKDDRVYFVNRYSYGDSVPEIAKRYNASEGKVTMSLHRTRKKLKAYLEKRGITL